MAIIGILVDSRVKIIIIINSENVWIIILYSLAYLKHTG